MVKDPFESALLNTLKILDGLKKLKHKYLKWFQTFLANINIAFVDTHAEGVLMVLSQRPAHAFATMPDNQLRHLIHGTFQEIIINLKEANDG